VAWSVTVTGSYLSVAAASGQPSQTLPLRTDLGTTGEVDVTALAVDLPR
jgi:hypothetical protein